MAKDEIIKTEYFLKDSVKMMLYICLRLLKKKRNELS